MTTKADYTDEEWQQLVQAPLYAGTLVMVSDMHVTSVLGEMAGMVKGMIQQPLPEGAEELIGSLVADIQDKNEKKEKIEGKNLF